MLATFDLITTTHEATQLDPLIRFHETPGTGSHNTRSFTHTHTHTKAEGLNDS